MQWLFALSSGMTLLKQDQMTRCGPFQPDPFCESEMPQEWTKFQTLYFCSCLCKKVPLLRKALSKGQVSTPVTAQLVALTLQISALAYGRVLHSVCQQKCCDKMKIICSGLWTVQYLLEKHRALWFTSVLLYFCWEKKISRGTYFIVNEISTAFLPDIEKN